MDWGNELAGAAAIFAMFLPVLVAAELWGRMSLPDPEKTRKFAHVSGGLVSLLIPVLVESVWTVLGLAVVISLAFGVTAGRGAFASIHGVRRSTWGCQLYPLGIFLAFALSGGQIWLYVSALLCLAVSDALAALVGNRCGTIRLGDDGSSKTLEGSLAFFASAFLFVLFPASLMTGHSAAACGLSAMSTALFATGAEAFSKRGTDNVTVPAGVCIVAGATIGMPLDALAGMTFMMVGAAVGAFCLLRSRGSAREASHAAQQGR